MKELIEIQAELKAPKDLNNDFGGYKYRSCEGILEAVKPLLKDKGCLLTITDEVVPALDRVYIKAIATISKGDVSVSVSALAREAETKKGMDAAQITGAASSYARKYALNGLFCIDDTKDADATNKHEKGTEKPSKSELPPDGKCPKCGNKAPAGALKEWGKCAKCKKEEFEKS